MRMHAQLLKEVADAVQSQNTILASGREAARGKDGLRSLKRLVLSVGVAVCHGLKVRARLLPVVVLDSDFFVSVGWTQSAVGSY